MEKIDLTKLTERELQVLSEAISKEIFARKDTKKNELAKAITQSIRAYTEEFGHLRIDTEDYDFLFTDESKYEFYPEDNMIIVN